MLRDDEGDKETAEYDQTGEYVLIAEYDLTAEYAETTEGSRRVTVILAAKAAKGVMRLRKGKRLSSGYGCYLHKDREGRDAPFAAFAASTYM